MTPATQLNAQVSKGFRLGGINDPLNAPICSPADLATFGDRGTWEDEELWNYEAGVKATFLGGRGTFNASAFYMDIRNLQATVTAGTCSSRIIFNVPDARSAGVELELAAQPTTFFDFALSASVADARLQSTVTSTDDTGAVGVVSGIEAGRRLPTTPRFQSAAAATWRWLAGGGWVGYVSGTFQHVGSRFTQVGDQAEGFGTVDLTALTPALRPGTFIGGPLTRVGLRLRSGASGLQHPQPAGRDPRRPLGRRLLHRQRHGRAGAAGPRPGAGHAGPRRLSHQPAAELRRQHANRLLTPARPARDAPLRPAMLPAARRFCDNAVMSGHSKWASIKHKKGVADARRGKLFTRIIKELTVAARDAGGDPGMNPRLRTVIADAKAANMPAENIKRAIRRGTGEEPGVTYEEVTYEAYGPGGAALLIQCLTDNTNRAVGEIRHLLSKHNGNLGTTNSVAWMFEKHGHIVVEQGTVDEEALMTSAIDAGADDFREDGDNWEIVSSPEAFEAVREAVTAAGAQAGFGPDRDAAPEPREARGQDGPADDQADGGAGGPGRHPARLVELRHRSEGDRGLAGVRILGVDPGSIRTGYGCIDTDGSRHRVVTCGALAPAARAGFPEKLLAIRNGLASLIAGHRPDVVAIEDLFYARNARSALKLGHVRGVVMLAASEAGLPVSEFTPAEVKRAVVGYGRADKPQVRQMVMLLLGLSEPPSPLDVSDALAVAVCHAHVSGPAAVRRAAAAAEGERGSRAASRRPGKDAGRARAVAAWPGRSTRRPPAAPARAPAAGRGGEVGAGAGYRPRARPPS